MAFLFRWLVTALALGLAVYFVPGLSMEGPGWTGLVVTALILGLVNAFIRPFVALLSLPLTILTLGLFTLVINAAMLLLASWLSGTIHAESRLVIDGWVAAILGALVVSIVSAVLSSVAEGA